jgi:hypothetical protein
MSRRIQDSVSVAFTFLFAEAGTVNERGVFESPFSPFSEKRCVGMSVGGRLRDHGQSEWSVPRGDAGDLQAGVDRTVGRQRPAAGIRSHRGLGSQGRS